MAHKTESETEPQTEDPAIAETHTEESALRALAAAMEGRKFQTALTGGVLAVYGQEPAGGGPRPVETVTCRVRVTDSDRMWFWDGADWLHPVDGGAVHMTMTAADLATRLENRK